jgi:hypothetical protein
LPWHPCLQQLHLRPLHPCPLLPRLLQQLSLLLLHLRPLHPCPLLPRLLQQLSLLLRQRQPHLLLQLSLPLGPHQLCPL